MRLSHPAAFLRIAMIPPQQCAAVKYLYMYFTRIYCTSIAAASFKSIEMPLVLVRTIRIKALHGVILVQPNEFPLRIVLMRSSCFPRLLFPYFIAQSRYIPLLLIL